MLVPEPEVELRRGMSLPACVASDNALNRVNAQPRRLE